MTLLAIILVILFFGWKGFFAVLLFYVLVGS